MAIYGASLLKKGTLESDYAYDAIGKNSEVFASGDPLAIASGLLSVATAGSEIVGVAAKTQTMASNNQTVAQVKPGYIPVTTDSLFYMGTNADLTGNATDGGTYYNITGTTGAVVVDVTGGVTTGANRVVEIVQVDPFNKGGSGAGSGLRECVVRFVKTPYLNVSITS